MSECYAKKVSRFWVGIFGVVLILIGLLIIVRPLSGSVVLSPDEVSESKEGEAVLGETSAKTCPGISFLDVLLDQSTSVPRDYIPLDLAPLSSRGFQNGGGFQLRAEAINQLVLLSQEAKNQHLSFGVVSAYRPFDTQTRLYQEWSKVLGATSNKRAAAPGHSEHQLGTALDLSLPNGEPIYPSAVWSWLDKNAYQFGFVMSYSKSQQNLTGMEFEPWHWRYVGVPLAYQIHQSSLAPQTFYRKISCL